MANNTIQLAETTADIQRCFPVMSQLRPHLKAKEFVSLVNRLQDSGFLLAYLEHDTRIVAVTGYRYLVNLHLGQFMYVDDLITDTNSRSSGYGKQLFDWLVKQAKKHSCTSMQLDSGVQRFEAHRFYLREHMIISSHHFSLDLTTR